MTIQPATDLAAPGADATGLAGPKPPPPPPASSGSLVARLAASGLILALYYVLYDRLIELFNGASELVIQTTPPPGTARVLAVTLLGAVLLPVWWKPVKKDKRFYAPLFITYILAVANAGYGVLNNLHSPFLGWLTGGRVTTYSPTFLAIAAAVALEVVLARFMFGKWPHLASAYITGISVGILIKSPHAWTFALCSMISIASKYVFRIGGKHLWNPSNFGITMMLLLAGNDVSSLSFQSGNTIWPVVLIWLMGGIILYSLGRLYLPVVFVAAFIPLAFLRTAIAREPLLSELAPITWPMFQLYIFFMITDPRTTTKARWSQCLVAVLVAVADTVLRLAFEDVHSLYHALFIVGPLSNLVEYLWTRGEQPAVRPAPQPSPA